MNKLQRHIANHCATYAGSGRCLLDRDCPYFSPETSQRCDYAERAVIPADDRLEFAYWQERGLKEWDEKTKACQSCGQPFEPSSNRQVYCRVCGQEEARKKKNKRNREYRAKRTL